MSIFFFQCKKSELLDSEESTSGVQRNILSKNWAEGLYITFASKEEFKKIYTELEEAYYSDSELRSGETGLDDWEDKNGFYSMRTAYSQYDELGLKSGLHPTQLADIPIIDDVLATLISPDGLVQIGEELYYFSDQLVAKAPIRMKATLKDVIEGDIELHCIRV